MHDGSCIGINYAHRFTKCFRSLHTLLCFSRCNQSILEQEPQSAKDTDMTCSKMLPVKTATCLELGPMSLDWPVHPFGRSDFPDLSCLLKFPAANNNKVPFQLLNVLAGDRMLFTHNHRYYNVLQGGMDVAPSFPKACDVCIAWNTRGLVGSVFSKQKNREFKLKYLKRLFDANNILCLQEVHGKDEYLQAIRVLAPRFLFFGTFIPDNENAGGSAICIHRDFLPEEAIVTHLTTCQCRDHFVNIQSGRHNFVIVNVHLESELILRQLRGRLRLIHPHWPAFPSGVGIILGDFNVIQKKDDLMSGTSHSPMATRERLLCSTLSSTRP